MAIIQRFGLRIIQSEVIKMVFDYEKVVEKLKGTIAEQLAAKVMGYDDILDIPVSKRVEWNELSKQL